MPSNIKRAFSQALYTCVPGTEQFNVDSTSHGHDQNTNEPDWKDVSNSDENTDTNTIKGNHSAAQCSCEQAVSGFCCEKSARTFWLRFMDLPLELREKIYTAMFADLPGLIALRPTRKWENLCFPPIVPAICYTNKQVLAESIPAFLRGRQFHIGVSPAFELLQRFLDQVPGEKAWKAITAIHHDARADRPALLQLANKCTGLRSVHIDICVSYCLNLDKTLENVSMKPIAEVRKTISLCGDVISILQLPNLRNLTIHCLGFTCLAAKLGVELADVSKHLATVLQEEHERQGAKCELRFRHVHYIASRTHAPFRMGWELKEDEAYYAL